MAQIRGTAGYNLGAQDNRFGGPGRADATNDPSPLDQIREQTSKIEDWLDTVSDPVKPYVQYHEATGDIAYLLVHIWPTIAQENDEGGGR